MIFAGAIVAVLPSLLHGEGGSMVNARWYACVIYFSSNIPMAASAVFKESEFKKQRPVKVWVLCFWVAVYQFLISWVFAPIIAVPFIGGSEEGRPISTIPNQLVEGANCWLGTRSCKNHSSTS